MVNEDSTEATPPIKEPDTRFKGSMSSLDAHVGPHVGPMVSSQRLAALLDSPDLAKDMATLTPLEAYHVIKEVGMDEAMSLVVHATPAQLQTWVDLDCWDKDNLDPLELDAWLSPFSYEGLENLAQAFLSLDREIQIFFLTASLHIYDAQQPHVPDPPSEATYHVTPDGFFILHSFPKDREVDPFRVIDALYRHDLEEAFRLLMAAQWELPLELQEQAFQFRSGRLEDLGFPPPSQAAQLFRKPPPLPDRLLKMQNQVSEHTTPAPSASFKSTTLPVLYATPLVQGANLLSRALKHLSDVKVGERLEHEILYLINAAVVAYGKSLRDLEGIYQIAHRVTDTVSLGLESLLEAPDPVRAAAILAHWPLLHLFQQGHQKGVPLQRQAMVLTQDPVVQIWLDVCLPPDEDPEYLDRAFLRALASPHPAWAGYDRWNPTATRAFATPHDLACAQSRLEALAQRLL